MIFLHRDTVWLIRWCKKLHLVNLTNRTSGFVQIEMAGDAQMQGYQRFHPRAIKDVCSITRRLIIYIRREGVVSMAVYLETTTVICILAQIPK